MKLSKNFTLEEFTTSQVAVRRGISNTPSSEALLALKFTAAQMEKVRQLLGVPIQISSGYRSPALNLAIGGSIGSAHCRGEAVDFIAPKFGTPKEICQFIVQSKLVFDQLIYEGEWVHIAFDSTPRKSILTAHFSGGTTRYSNGIV